MAFVLFSGARPGWERSRLAGSLGDAFARAAVAAIGLAGLTRLISFVAARLPAAFSFDPSLPGALETAFPALGAPWAAVRSTIGLAAVVAVLVLALRHPFFQKPSGRWLGALMVLVAVIPTSFHSMPEFLASFGTPVVVVAYLAVMTCLLLKDHVGAWILFGVFAFGGRAAAALLSQPAAEDQAAGGIGVALVLIGAIALLAGRRQGLAESSAPAPVQGNEP